MKDLSAAKKILDIKITRDRKSGLLFLSKHDHTNKVLHPFNMPDAKKVTTRADLGGLAGQPPRAQKNLGALPAIDLVYITKNWVFN
jgi:hypothetical protein